LICFRDSRMLMVLRLEGFYSAPELIQYIAIAVGDNRPFIDAARRERAQHDADAQIRREQEEAYQASLLADRERQNETRRRDDERTAQERRAANDRHIALDRKEKLTRLKSEISAQLRPEPDASVSECVRVSLRFPNGKSFEHRFLPDDSLELLFNVAFVHADCPDDFTLVSCYPRRALHCAPTWYAEFSQSTSDSQHIPTFRECELVKAVAVLVQNNNA